MAKSLKSLCVKQLMAALEKVGSDKNPKGYEALIRGALSQFPFGENFREKIVELCRPFRERRWNHESRGVFDRVFLQMKISEKGKTSLEIMFREEWKRTSLEISSIMYLKLQEPGTFEVNFSMIPLLEAMPTLNCALHQDIEIWQLDPTWQVYDEYQVAISGQYWPFRELNHAYDLLDPGPADENMSLCLNLFDLVTGMLVGDVSEFEGHQGDSLWCRLSALCPISNKRQKLYRSIE